MRKCSLKTFLTLYILAARWRVSGPALSQPLQRCCRQAFQERHKILTEKIYLIFFWGGGEGRRGNFLRSVARYFLSMRSITTNIFSKCADTVVFSAVNSRMHSIIALYCTQCTVNRVAVFPQTNYAIFYLK